MKRIELAKYGFIRWPEEDFSNDGNRFTCYRVGKRVRVSKLVSDGEAYIRASIDCGMLPYDIYSKLPYYKMLGALNGVSVSSITEEDLQELYEACISYETAYDRALAEMTWPTKEALANKARELFNAYVAVYNKLEEELQFNMLTIANKCSSYEWSSLRDYIQSFRNSYDNYSNPEAIAERDYQQLRSLDFVKKVVDVENDFWVKRIRAIIEKYSD